MKKTLLFFMAVFVLSSCAVKQNPKEEKVKTNSASNTSINKIDKVVEIDEGIKIVKFYKNNQPTGTWQWFDEDDILFMEQSYENGKLHGWHRVYDKNGKVVKEVPYQQGVVHGIWTEYRIEGDKSYPQFEEHLVNGETVLFKFYDENGELSSKTTIEKVDMFITQDYENGRFINEYKGYQKCVKNEKKELDCESWN